MLFHFSALGEVPYSDVGVRLDLCLAQLNLTTQRTTESLQLEQGTTDCPGNIESSEAVSYSNYQELDFKITQQLKELTEMNTDWSLLIQKEVSSLKSSYNDTLLLSRLDQLENSLSSLQSEMYQQSFCSFNQVRYSNLHYKFVFN